jgi:hypothetical protein
MIDRHDKLPVARQCQILELARSTAYYQPQPVSPEDLALMRRIDELHLEMPYAGARMLSRLLKREGKPVGRKRVSTLMQRMDIHALYRKPNTSRRHPAHKVYPYLLRNLEIVNQRTNLTICQRPILTSRTRSPQGFFSLFEAEGIIAGFDDVAVVGNAIQ